MADTIPRELRVQNLLLGARTMKTKQKTAVLEPPEKMLDAGQRQEFNERLQRTPFLVNRLKPASAPIVQGESRPDYYRTGVWIWTIEDWLVSVAPPRCGWLMSWNPPEGSAVFSYTISDRGIYSHLIDNPDNPGNGLEVAGWPKGERLEYTGG